MSGYGEQCERWAAEGLSGPIFDAGEGIRPDYGPPEPEEETETEAEE